jgi:hypothetical protein
LGPLALAVIAQVPDEVGPCVSREWKTSCQARQWLDSVGMGRPMPGHARAVETRCGKDFVMANCKPTFDSQEQGL